MRAIRSHLVDAIVIVLLIVLSAGIVGYILAHQRLRFPLVEEGPFVLEAEFANARGVMPGQGQTVRVAGMRVGDIGEVNLREGLAVVRMELDPEHDELVRRDATALLRPRTGLKDMFLELDPGSTSEPPLEEGDVIVAENTAPDNNPDQVLEALDTDARAYLRLLLTGAGKGLYQRGGDLREVFRRLGPLFRDIERLNQQVATRRENLKRLVDNTNSTVTTLARRDDELARLVSSSNRVFRAIGSEDQNVSSAIRQLPPTLAQAEETLGTVNELGRTLPAFESLRPVVRQLDETNRRVLPFARQGEPILRNKVRPLVREARPFLRDVKPAARNLAKASPDLRDSFFELNRFFNIGARNPGGAEELTGDIAADRGRDEGYLFWLAWVSQNAVSVFSTGDAQGPFRRFIAGATCTTYSALINQSPSPELTAALYGVIDLLNDPGLCPK